MPQPNPDELEAAFQRLVAAHPLPLSSSTHSGETIYDVLKTLPEASAYHQLLERYPRLVALLADVSDGEVTLFLPVNAAWEGAATAAAGLSGVDAEADADAGAGAEEALLAMHVSPHFLDQAYLRSMTNVPTIHAPGTINRPQVFPLRLGEAGWTLAGGGRFLAGEGIRARNGLIYRIDRVITPPGALLEVLRLRGTHTTLLHAVEVAGFAAELASRPGGTLFAPSDRALASLGPEALRFLTESAEGRKYLNALLRGHFCPVHTHYTNLVWPQNDGAERRTSAEEDRVYKGSMRRELPSALCVGEQAVSLEVSITRYMCLIAVAVNGTPVVEQDIGGEDGVAQGIDEVLLPGGVVGKGSEDLISHPVKASPKNCTAAETATPTANAADSA
ncbi:FAS1 domain protein [Cordyceps fumosorosea ARSEF 2679]|uniref:FAS1 domain protein n=1 Tax=Cordyceps fumosorosea (strain ARSEF 2679) TaxID=1081104 RepID=A0A167NKG3_CORFA|nr:FAS1 domain protein [Cordyceps fumosorosea ARSEF 2679]OAA55648.1 FAS1 domain protein [Cordyceps fumosorosea ARSEF 2679]